MADLRHESTGPVKPILFNTEMVRATLDGRKTETRRVVNPIPPPDARLVMSPDPDNRYGWDESREIPDLGPNDRRVYYPRYYPGDILYVRETWAEMPYGYAYRADDENPEGWDCEDRWHPSIHMPAEAARIFLRVTDVRVERLQQISREAAIAEGCNEAIPILEFERIWNGTLKHMDHIRYGWTANPWVWVISFERCEKPEGWPWSE